MNNCIVLCCLLFVDLCYGYFDKIKLGSKFGYDQEPIFAIGDWYGKHELAFPWNGWGTGKLK